MLCDAYPFEPLCSGLCWDMLAHALVSIHCVYKALKLSRSHLSSCMYDASKIIRRLIVEQYSSGCSSGFAGGCSMMGRGDLRWACPRQPHCHSPPFPPTSYSYYNPPPQPSHCLASFDNLYRMQLQYVLLCNPELLQTQCHP